MLQRQIIFKQLQELQRRQQLPELGDARNQNYINQLSWGRSPSAVNETPVHDSSQMLTVDSMQMMQRGGSAVVQELSNELELLQSQNHSIGQVGLSQPQFDASFYENSAPNTDKNLELYSHLQGPSNHSGNSLSKNNNSPLVMPSMQPSAFGNSFLSPRCNFSSDQISLPDESSLPNQVFQEKNLFQQVPAQGFNNGMLSGNYSPQGMTVQRNASFLESDGRHENVGWHGLSPRKASNSSLSQPAASLDPLEQKILYNTDDNSWESSFIRSSNIGSGAFGSTMEHTSYMDVYPSTQRGSWSALMQSAVAETSSSDSGMQEEWIGLNFHNPEPSTDIQPSNFIDSAKQKNNWVDINPQNSFSPSATPERMFQNSNMNSTFPCFQQSGHQYLKLKEGFHPESSHASTQHSPRNTSQLTDYNSQQKHHTGGSQLLQTSSLPNVWPGQQKEHLKNDVQSILSCTNGNQPRNNFSGHELSNTIWLHESTQLGIQKPFDQVNQLNIHRYLIESEKMASGNNAEPIPALLTTSSDLQSQSMTTQTSKIMLDLLNKDNTSINHAPGMQLNAEVSTPNELPLTETSIASFAKPCNISPMSPDPRTPQSNSYFPSLLMGNSTSPSSHNVIKNVENQHYPASPKPSHMATNFPVYSAATSLDNCRLKNTDSRGPELPFLESGRVTQPSVTLVSSQHVGFPMERSTLWPDMTTQQDVSSSKPQKFSNLFYSLDSVASSLETSSVAPNEQPNQNSFKQEFNVQEFRSYSGKSEYREQRLEKGSSHQEDSSEINNSISVSRYNHDQESSRKHHLEADAGAPGSLITHSHQPPSITPEQIDNETPAYPARDFKALGHSLSENHSLLHQVEFLRNADSDCAKRLPINYNSVNYQQTMAKAKDLFLSGQREGVKYKAKEDLDEGSQFGVFSSADNKGWDLQEAHRDQSGKAYLQNVQEMQMFGQNDNQSHSIGSYDTSSATYQSQVSLQLAPSLFKHCETLKNGQLLSTYGPKAAINTVQQFSGITLESSMWPSTAATLIVSRQLSPTMLSSGVTNQNLAVSLPKKRKIVAFDMVPWYKEVNHGPFRLQNISVAELEWAQASNRRHEEVKNEADIVEDVLPVFRAKRRLVFTTQLMQQVFRPAPAVILSTDASSNFDDVAYSAARLGLADACSVNSNSQMPFDGNGMSPGKLKISKRTNACDFSKVVEGLINRVKKLEGDLLRMDKGLSIVDLKVESQELEKFSIINRFAKFHIKAHSRVVDPTSSSGTLTEQKTYPQRYVIALPMPKTIPEGADCYSL